MALTKSRDSELIGSTRSLVLITTGMVLAAIWPAALASVLSPTWNLGMWGFPVTVFLFVAVSAVSGVAVAGLIVRLRGAPLWMLSSSFVLGSLALLLAVITGTRMFNDVSGSSASYFLYLAGLPLGVGVTAAISVHRRRHSTRDTVLAGLSGFAVGFVALVPLDSVSLATVDEVYWGDVVRIVVSLLVMPIIPVIILAGPISVVWWKWKHRGTRIPTAPLVLLGLSAAVVTIVVVLAASFASSEPEFCPPNSDGQPSCMEPATL